MNEAALDYVISQLLDRDDGMLQQVVQLMVVDDRGTAEATLRRAIGKLPPLLGDELPQRVEAVIAQCKRFEREREPQATAGLPNDISRAQGELAAAEFLRELLEQELPPELVSHEVSDEVSLYHERNFWSWKHSRRVEEIRELREELDPDNPNYLPPQMGPMPAMGLIGRDRALLDKFAKELHSVGELHEHSPLREGLRGSSFEVRLAAGDGDTGRVVRVTVELDRVEDGESPSGD